MNKNYAQKQQEFNKKRHDRELKLLGGIKAKLTDLEKLKELFDLCKDEVFYRFYNQSFKVFRYQTLAKEAVQIFSEIDPNLNKWFVEIVKKGTEKEFDLKMNKNWVEETKSIVEAFSHSYYFLNALINCGKTIEKIPDNLNSEWASALCLFENP